MAGNSLKRRGFALAQMAWRSRKPAALAILVIGAVLGWLAGRSIGAPGGVAVAAATVLLMAGGLLASGLVLKLRSSFGEVSAAIDNLRGDIKGLRQSFDNDFSDLRRRNQSLQEATRDLRFQLEERTNRHAVQLSEQRKNLAAHGGAIAGADKRQGIFEERLDSIQISMKHRLHALDVQAGEAVAQFKKVDERLALKANAEKLARFEERAIELKGGLRDLSDRMRGYHVHDRMPSKTDREKLRIEWAEPLGLTLSDANIGYLASRVAAIEGKCVGRLATASQTMVARLLAARSIDRPALDILEIGVLFGVASACFYDACSDLFGSVSLTLVDPLEGYYDRDAADLVTGVRVTRGALEKNLSATGVPAAAHKIIQKLSGDPAAIAAASVREYDLLLIDGDHSYDGVRQDFENYAPLVRKGGIILFDDYAVSEWPEIKRYVDESAAMNPALNLIANGFRTAAFRVVDKVAAR